MDRRELDQFRRNDQIIYGAFVLAMTCAYTVLAWIAFLAWLAP